MAANLEREFNNARDSVANFGRQLDEKRRQLVDLDDKLRELGNEVQNAPRVIEAAARPFTEGVTALKGIAAQDVVLYDVSTALEASYNAKVGVSWYKATLPAGVKISSAAIKSALAANPTPPNIDPVGLAISSGLVEARISDSYGKAFQQLKERKATTFVSSRRFVDNLSLENAASDAVLAVFTGGASLKTAAEERVELLIMEWADILAWLNALGAAESEKLAGHVISAVMNRIVGNGDAVTLPDVTVQSQSTPYIYSVRPRLPVEIVNALKLIGIDAQARLSGTASVPHLMYAIKVRGLKAPSVSEVLGKFKTALTTGPSLDIDRAIAASGVNLPFSAAAVRNFVETDPGNLRGILKAAIEPALSNLESDHVGGLVFDLTTSSVARDLEKRLSVLAAGNGGGVKIRELILDGTSLAIRLKADVRHRHSIGTVGDLAKGLGEKATQVTRSIAQGLEHAKQRVEVLQRQRNQLNASITDMVARVIPGANARVAQIRQQVKPICDGLTVFGERPPVCNF